MGRERPGKRSGTTGLLRTVMGGGVSSLDARLGLAMDGFGLINLDEFDRLPDRKMALLKNWMQMAGMNVRKAHAKHSPPTPPSLIYWHYEPEEPIKRPHGKPPFPMRGGAKQD